MCVHACVCVCISEHVCVYIYYYMCMCVHVSVVLHLQTFLEHMLKCHYMSRYLQLFLTHRSYPSVVPITVVTEGGETDEFCAHFLSWPLVDFSLTQGAEHLKLEEEKHYEVVFPASRGTTVSS